jgi:hypothetical protein
MEVENSIQVDEKYKAIVKQLEVTKILTCMLTRVKKMIAKKILKVKINIMKHPNIIKFK